MSAPNFPPDRRQAPLSLWRRVRDFVGDLFGICGQPEELAAKHTLTFRDYKILLPWIRAGEALLRRFLLLEAALLKPAPQRTAAFQPVSSKQPRRRQCADLDPDAPDAWRVSFRATVADHRLPAGAPALQLPQTEALAALRHVSRFRSAIPLARRLEAILRVYNNPAPFARRLAARLRKIPALLGRLANDAWATCGNLIGDLYDAILDPIAEAQRQLTNTS